MNSPRELLGSALAPALLLAAAQVAVAAGAAVDCTKFDIDAQKSVSLGDGSARPNACKVRLKDGYPVPDPKCTPGATNPTLTSAVLRDPDFRTGCVRDNATSAKQKAQTYEWYGIAHPTDNRGVKQVCELDHLVSLELGGADTLDNIWPQCGPDHVVLKERFFKIKDAVENYLAKRVKEGSLELKEAQQRISQDWTQFIDKALGGCMEIGGCDD